MYLGQLILGEEDGGIILRPRGLYWKNGIPVYETGPLPPDHVIWVDQDREDRADELMLMGEFPVGGLYMDRGSLVYDPGPAPPIDVLEWIALSREERIESFTFGPSARNVVDDTP